MRRKPEGRLRRTLLLNVRTKRSFETCVQKRGTDLYLEFRFTDFQAEIIQRDFLILAYGIPLLSHSTYHGLSKKVPLHPLSLSLTACRDHTMRYGHSRLHS